MPSISLCMIVKNEEKTLRRCLDSVKELVFEIIIVDTGSTDKTITICKEYTSSVYSHPWTNDFSEARNKSISYATGDWILYMDADEMLSYDDINRVLKPLSDSQIIYSVQIQNLQPSLLDINTGMDYFYQERLFPNTKKYQFIGDIYERLDPINQETKESTSFLPSLSIIHYDNDLDDRMRKGRRNLSMLLKTTSFVAKDDLYAYYLAFELFRCNNYKESYEIINSAILNFINRSLLPPSKLYRLKYDILFTSKSISDIKDGLLRVIKLYPDYVDFHYYLGVYYFMNEEYSNAITSLSYCLLLGEYHPEYTIQKGTGTFLAANLLGQCYEKQKNQKASDASYRLTRATDSSIN